MQPLDLGDFQLDYEEAGTGEPVLLIHGGFVDTFFPTLAELRLAENHRVIAYHRRGYADSSSATPPFSIRQQADDARALLEHLGVKRAHVAGHSFGGIVALELARETPELVGSLSLLEPALVAAVPSGLAFMESLAGTDAMYAKGDHASAVAAFFTAVAGPDFRDLLEKILPAGAYDRVLADAQTPFEIDLASLGEWNFTAEDVARIRQPVLCVRGADSVEVFQEIHALVTQWFTHAESLVVPNANHMLPYMNPHATSEGIAAFLARHPL